MLSLILMGNKSRLFLRQWLPWQSFDNYSIFLGRGVAKTDYITHQFCGVLPFLKGIDKNILSVFDLISVFSFLLTFLFYPLLRSEQSELLIQILQKKNDPSKTSAMVAGPFET